MRSPTDWQDGTPDPSVSQVRAEWFKEKDSETGRVIRMSEEYSTTGDNSQLVRSVDAMNKAMTYEDHSSDQDSNFFLLKRAGLIGQDVDIERLYHLSTFDFNCKKANIKGEVRVKLNKVEEKKVQFRGSDTIPDEFFKAGLRYRLTYNLTKDRYEAELLLTGLAPSEILRYDTVKKKIYTLDDKLVNGSGIVNIVAHAGTMETYDTDIPSTLSYEHEVYIAPGNYAEYTPIGTGPILVTISLSINLKYKNLYGYVYVIKDADKYSGSDSSGGWMDSALCVAYNFLPFSSDQWVREIKVLHFVDNTRTNEKRTYGFALRLEGGSPFGEIGRYKNDFYLRAKSVTITELSE